MLKKLLILVCALGFVACSGLPYNAVAPKVRVAGVEIKRLGLFEQHFDVELRVSNPNDFDLNIVALELDLAVNGRPFASGLTTSATHIPAMSSALLKVDAITQSQNLILQFKDLQSESLKAGVSYRITGRIKTDQSSRWIPFDHTGMVGRDENKSKGRAI